MLQIYPDGIRHIRSDKRVNEWKTPGKKTIVKCAVNQRQVVIALTGGELVYFEMDPTGQLNEYTERKEMSSDVICMALGRVPAGEQRSRFLAVGLADNTVRIISLDPTVRIIFALLLIEFFVDWLSCNFPCSFFWANKKIKNLELVEFKKIKFCGLVSNIVTIKIKN